MNRKTQQNQPQQKPTNIDNIDPNLIQTDQQFLQIANLNTKKLQRTSQAIKQIKSNRISTDFRQKPRKQQYIQFDQQLNLDMLIDRLLQNLMKTKVQLLQMNDQQLIKQNQKTQDFKPYFIQQLKKYNKTILLRQSQLGALIYMMQNKANKDYHQKYLSIYKQLDKFIVSPQQSSKPINTVILQQAFQTQIQFLQQYLDMITLVKLNLVHKKYLYDMESLTKAANRLKIINSKIATIAELFPYACVMDKNDLFSFKKTHQKWKNLLQSGYILYKLYGDAETIRNSFLQLKSGINLVNATMSIMHQSKQHWLGTAKNFAKDLNNLAESTGKIFKCLLWKQNATHQSQVLISQPDSELAKQIWNLPQQKMFKNLISTILPSINFSKQFYIPRIFTSFLSSQTKTNPPKIVIQNLVDYSKAIYDVKQYKERLPMRINSSFNLIRRFEKQQKPLNHVNNIFGSLAKQWKYTKQQRPPQAVIYHIHGGGFISMSSFIHQTYTRVWANNLKVPIISVDYGKAPQYPFPLGLYDCFQGYMWTLQCFQQVFDIEPTKIILVGDSAGGNLVAALTSLLIQLKMRKPDGICLVYPALNLNYHSYTPSLLTSLNDLILPHTFLKVCLKAYLKQGIDPHSPQVSPLYSSDEVLKNYPPTRLFVGSKDPFHDDCCRITQRLNNLSPDKAKLMIFNEFPHGFLQFDMKTQPHEQCRKATKQVQHALLQLLKL